jgi:DNA invertase Pin-like site-specific DNA recombinase
MFSDPSKFTARALGYVRVSTAEQAEHQTSRKQQKADLKAYCARNAIDLIEIFDEPGLSGSDWSRPLFNRMIDLATGDDHPVDFIIAADMSRIARDVEFSILTEGRLRRANVAFRFVFQQFQDGHHGRLLKLVTSWQDEEYVIKAAQNTRRGLRGTAAEGFWLGGRVPLGFESRTVEVRGKKEKKKLFVNEPEAEVVRLIFDIAERGFDGSPLGGRAIAEYLNSNGYTLRGARFHNSNVADLMQRPHYLGRFPGSKVDEFGKLLPEDEWIWVECPQIISQKQFDRVAALRASRAPRVTAPHIVAGTTLLVGVAKCGMPGCGYDAGKKVKGRK